MPQVVNAQPADLGGPADAPPIGFDLDPVTAVTTRKHVLGVVLAPAMSWRAGALSGRRALCAVLLCAGLGPNAGLEIDVIPARRQDLATPRAGQQQEPKDIRGVRVVMLG